MKTKNILFRADSSSTIGTGHIMRDLVLAEQFEDAQIYFATQELDGNINHKILEKGYTLKSLTSNMLEELIFHIEELSINMIVIDHYAINYAFEKELKEKIAIKLMVLDDTYEKHYCDVLLNHNIYADEKKYLGLVPSHCELRCGEKFTLLRREFIEAKQIKVTKDKNIKNIFVAMGGTDIANLNPKIIEVLETFDNIHVDIVTTQANPHLKALQEYVTAKPWVTLHINSTQIATLIAKGDLAIITASVTMNEVWYMGVPFIAIQTSDNQSCMSDYLIKHNYFVLNKFEPYLLRELIKKMK